MRSVDYERPAATHFGHRILFEKRRLADAADAGDEDAVPRGRLKGVVFVRIGEFLAL